MQTFALSAPSMSFYCMICVFISDFRRSMRYDRCGCNTVLSFNFRKIMVQFKSSFLLKDTRTHSCPEDIKTTECQERTLMLLTARFASLEKN